MISFDGDPKDIPLSCVCGFPPALNTSFTTWEPEVTYHTWWVGHKEWGYVCTAVRFC